MRIYTCAPTPPVPRPAWASAAGSRATTPPGPIRHSAIGRPMRSTNHRRSRGLLRHRSVWQHDRHYSPQGDRPELRSLSRLSKLGGPAQMHDLGVINPLSHFCQQPVVPDIVKVGTQVEVEDACLPLDYCLSHSLDRVMCCPLGPISKRLEIRLEDRFEYELERALHHSVADCRNRKDADFAPVLWYLLPPGWEWLVGVPSQLVP